MLAWPDPKGHKLHDSRSLLFQFKNIFEVALEFDNDAINRFLKIKAIEEELEKDRKRLQFDYKVFLSYSTVDLEIAKDISRVLTDLQISHFFDQKDISWGEDVVKGVSENLKSCTHLLVLLSPASLKSSWVTFEIGQASALSKVILPYLTHSSLDVPDFIRSYHYKTRLEDIKEFFSKPAINKSEVEELYKIIMSRLPKNLQDYKYCLEESSEKRKVWRSIQLVHVVDGLGTHTDEYSRIFIENHGTFPEVRITHYRKKGFGEEIGWKDTSIISYNIDEHSIEAFDNCRPLEWGARNTASAYKWAASVAFWNEIVKMLLLNLSQK